jgi:hypothetical protein
VNNDRSSIGTLLECVFSQSSYFSRRGYRSSAGVALVCIISNPIEFCVTKQARPM